MRQFIFFWLFLISFPFRFSGQELVLPLKQDSVRFAVIGDSGSGSAKQYELASLMAEWRKKFPFDFVIMLGDNIYGGEKPRDFQKKFEEPYKALLDQGINFYASLGNHDNPNQRFYKPFNMKEQRYYAFTRANVRFFVLDSNYMNPTQLDWLEKELRGSTSAWKISYFHHPLYSSGEAHGPDNDLRLILEPLFLKYGVNVVFAGHEHFYERINPQKGIYYFISGAASKLRRHNIARTDLTATGFDLDLSFMLVEIAGDEFHFQTIARLGKTVDSGTIHRTLNKTGDVTGELEYQKVQTLVTPSEFLVQGSVPSY
jgi:predicted MPP superfamily phosphohydrolase